MNRRPERTDSTKMKLFVASMELMGSGGIAETRVEDVAARAGVAKGSVYYNFGSKNQMVDELLKFGIDQLEAHLEDNPAPENSTPLESARTTLREGFIFLDRYPSLARLWMAQAWQGPSDWSETIDDIRARVVSILQLQIRACAPEETEERVRLTAVALFGSVFTLSVGNANGMATSSIEERVETSMLPILGLVA